MGHQVVPLALQGSSWVSCSSSQQTEHPPVSGSGRTASAEWGPGLHTYAVQPVWNWSVLFRLSTGKAASHWHQVGTVAPLVIYPAGSETRRTIYWIQNLNGQRFVKIWWFAWNFGYYIIVAAKNLDRLEFAANSNRPSIALHTLSALIYHCQIMHRCKMM